MNPDPRGQLPLTAVAFEILLVLSDSELHGYAIMQAVEESTGGTMVLYPGTLYRAIDRLERNGLISQAKGLPLEGEDQRRRYYALTKFGRRVAMAESVRLAQRVAVARALKLLPAGV